MTKFKPFDCAIFALLTVSIAAGQDLMFHNTLGSPSEIATSTVGPPLVPQTVGNGLYVPAAPVFGSGLDGGAVALGAALPPWSYSISSRDRLFALSNATGVVKAEHGTVESVFRILSTPGTPATGWNFLHLVDGPYEEDPNSKFAFTVGGQFVSPGIYTGIRVYFSIRHGSGGTAVAPVSLIDGMIGVDITGELHSWIKATAVWDRGGILGSTDTIRIYINGVIKGTATANNWATAVGPVFDIGGCAAFGTGQYFYDDLKIWEGARLPTPSSLALRFQNGTAPGGTIVTASFGHPGDRGFTALSFDPANSEAGFGTGWMAGLHISMNDLILQWVSSAPPFVFDFDGIGSYYVVLTPFQVAPFSGMTVYGVTLSLDPLTTMIHDVSVPIRFMIP